MHASMSPLTPPRRVGRLKRPDCEIHYEVTGSGPAVVFAHGLGGNTMSWWQQVGHFAPTHTCVTFAHRGFAPSSMPPGGPDPADFADDLAALVDELGLERFHLVGQSMGGWTAVEYALRRTGKLAGAVLCNTTGSLDFRRIPQPWLARVDDWERESRATAARLVQAGVHPGCGERMAHEQPALHGLYLQIDQMGHALDKDAFRPKLSALRRRDPAEIAGIGCPVLCIVGTEDILIPPFAQQAIASVAPNVSVALIEAAGHSAYFERAAQFNAVLQRFVLAR
jgi:3-oxoadipate enol-lactonase